MGGIFAHLGVDRLRLARFLGLFEAKKRPGVQAIVAGGASGPRGAPRGLGAFGSRAPSCDKKRGFGSKSCGRDLRPRGGFAWRIGFAREQSPLLQTKNKHSGQIVVGQASGPEWMRVANWAGSGAELPPTKRNGSFGRDNVTSPALQRGASVGSKNIRRFSAIKYEK